MAIETRGEIIGKICSKCRKWKPLSDFPKDRTHGESQGGRHCRCKLCHSEVRKINRTQK